LSPDDLNVIRYNDEGVGMLEDNLFATEDTTRSDGRQSLRHHR